MNPRPISSVGSSRLLSDLRVVFAEIEVLRPWVLASQSFQIVLTQQMGNLIFLRLKFALGLMGLIPSLAAIAIIIPDCVDRGVALPLLSRSLDKILSPLRI